METQTMQNSIWSNDINLHHSPSLTNNLQLPSYKTQMDTESLKSGHSERLHRKPRGIIAHSASNHIIGNNGYNQFNSLTLQNNIRFNNQTFQQQLHSQQNHLNHNNSNHNHHTNAGYSTTSRTLAASSARSHRATRSERNFISKLESPYTSTSHRRDEEMIEVQIIPQDDTWADNTTAVTGNTSDHSVSIEGDLNKIGQDPNNSKDKEFWFEQSFSFRCQMWTGTIVASFLSLCAFLSPILMVILPKLETLDWKVQECGPECDGLLISFSFKLLILLFGTWALFFRAPRATMPRIYVYRAVVLALIFIFMVSYWLFYAVRIAERRFNEYELSYHSIVLFAVSLVDALLFIHYLAVILIEVRHQQPRYFVQVTRSPDGYSKCYNIGDLSIQRAAVWILEHYYQDFPIYNPYLDMVPRRKSKSSGSMIGNSANLADNQLTSPQSTLKFYDVDGIQTETNVFGNSLIGQTSSPLTGNNNLLNNSSNNNNNNNNHHNNHNNSNHISRSIINSDLLEERINRRGKSSSHRHRHRNNDRFHEEIEFEKKVKKRKARLISAAEDAFTHIKRIEDEQGPAIPMDSYEAAQAIFPTFARTLQKYLRTTRQQPRHTMQSILNHLSLYLTYDMSPKAFLNKYFKSKSVLTNDKESKEIQSWGLVCDILLSRSIEDGTVFMLRQADVSLLVTVYSLPHFNITEEIIDPKTNKFVFRLNSETSV